MTILEKPFEKFKKTRYSKQISYKIERIIASPSLQSEQQFLKIRINYGDDFTSIYNLSSLVSSLYVLPTESFNYYDWVKLLNR